jgi:hypothetical protein
MSRGPCSGDGRRSPSLLALVLVAAISGWSCAATGLAPPGGASGGAAGASTAPITPATTAVTPAPATAGASPEPDPSPETTAVPGPPTALLVGPVRGEVAGDLGSFSWDGFASDSPWIVEPAGNALAPGTRPRVRLRGDPVHGAWTARWAPIEGRQTGRPVLAGRGGDDPIVVDPPPGAGSWSLQLEVTFARGRRAAWYWRVRVGA